MKILVVGDGLIGGSLVYPLRSQGYEVIVTSRRSNASDRLFLDLAEGVADWDLPVDYVDATVLCAGMTKLKACEEDLERSWLVNVTNTQKLIDVMVGRGSLFVFLSSDKAVGSTCEYGVQKWEVEKYLREKYADRSLIIRLPKVLAEAREGLLSLPLSFVTWVVTASVSLRLAGFMDLTRAHS